MPFLCWLHRRCSHCKGFVCKHHFVPTETKTGFKHILMLFSHANKLPENLHKIPRSKGKQTELGISTKYFLLGIFLIAFESYLLKLILPVWSQAVIWDLLFVVSVSHICLISFMAISLSPKNQKTWCLMFVWSHSTVPWFYINILKQTLVRTFIPTRFLQVNILDIPGLGAN